MEVDIDLNSVVEKPKLPADQPFTFGFKKANLEMAKQPNKKGERNWVVKCELSPVEPDWQDRVVYHNWSLGMGGLQSDDPCFSIKKFFTIVSHTWGPDGKFVLEDLYTINFVGTVKYPKDNPNFPQLASVLQRA
jgi:hypothetical protein